jgi:hypothetical protein
MPERPAGQHPGFHVRTDAGAGKCSGVLSLGWMSMSLKEEGIVKNVLKTTQGLPFPWRSRARSGEV